MPLLVGLGAFLLYAFTAAPSVVELYDDSLEFQLVGPTFGIAHPTGYPLYTLLGGLWSRLLFPFGNWAWRMNLFSAVAGAAAVAVTFLLVRRLTHGNNWAGLAAAVAFALSPVWWSQTTVAEVYALHGLFVTAILYAAIRLDKRGRTKDDGRPADDRTGNPFHISRVRRYESRTTHDAPPTHYSLLITSLLIGLSLAHHRTTLLLLPGLALYLLWTVPSLWGPRRAWITWAVALFLPLLFYLYIPIRAAMGVQDLQGDYVNTWQGFWNHVLALGYTGFFAENPLAISWSLVDWGALFRAQFGWLGLVLGALGFIFGLHERRHRTQWLLIAVTFVANLLFAINYRVADVEVFAIPAFLCIALAIGRGVAGFGALFSRRITRVRVQDRRRRTVQALLLLALIFFPLNRGPVIDRSDDWRVHNYAVAMAKVDFPPQSQVVGLLGQMTALEYMQQAEGLGVQATTVPIDNPEQRRAFVEQMVATDTPLYLTQELSGIESRYSFSGHGPLVRVWPRGAAEVGPPAIVREETVAGGALHLKGYDLQRLAQPGRPALQVAFYWQPAHTLDRTLKLSLRLLDADGNELVQADRFPLHQVAYTEHWLPGETVRDVHVLSLVEIARHLLVIVYDAETIEEVGRFTLDLPAN